jgi:hypothetical protein
VFGATIGAVSGILGSIWAAGWFRFGLKRRRTANLAVKGPQLFVQVRKRRADEDVHSAQQMVLRNNVIQVGLVERSPLVSVLSSPPISDQQESAFAQPVGPLASTYLVLTSPCGAF